MTVFTSIEEKFCASAKKNVAIEVTQMKDGSVNRKCLSQACGGHHESYCKFSNPPSRD